ncbi:hypothetical protein KHC28_27120 [Ancylobacter sonchi]|uniref:hypothetical protein n=1 Tax=Ancylobacter sonchi TaxID=1937790 RepID=UPI001BD2EFEB|nr:hypothetical protein [Ancylobacter sonchi]MBS7537327.1 hypothetical protein [Ancylobacter sonchi]
MIANATEIDAVIEKLETAVIADKMARSDEFGVKRRWNGPLDRRAKGALTHF